MKSSLFSNSIKHVATLGAAALIIGLPLTASAATISGDIDESSLTTSIARPTLSGTATGTRTVGITIRKEGSTKRIYANNAVRVRDGEWYVRINKKLADGIYDVELVSSKSTKARMLMDENLIVDTDASTTTYDTKSSSTLSIASIPLLSGGVSRAGASIPISYLQVVNTGKDPAVVKGFWIKQNGSASTNAIIGLTASDDAMISSYGSVGGTEGTVVFKDGMAFVPVETTIAPGTMRLFTIKAMLTSSTFSYIGTQLKLDVASVDTNASQKGLFPILGTTWIIGY